jgi:TM2 domain-containing membrane protein YozV
MLVAYVLWFFLGYLGIHRFYLGRPVSGVIWLCTGGLLGVGWLIDLVLTAFMVEDENGGYAPAY